MWDTLLQHIRDKMNLYNKIPRNTVFNYLFSFYSFTGLKKKIKKIMMRKKANGEKDLGDKNISSGKWSRKKRKILNKK